MVEHIDIKSKMIFDPDEARCEICMYWDQLGGIGSQNGIGYCRRNPPKTSRQWPTSADGDYCGEWIPR